MSVRVLFDDIEISTDYIYELSREYKLFGDNFELGCTPAQCYTLVVDKLGVEETLNPAIVKIVDTNTTLATLQVDNIEESDTLTLKYTLVDAMVNFEFNYDASPLMPTDENGTYPTLLDIVNDICSQAGVTLSSNSFYGYDKEIRWYDNTITARQYIGFVAELNAGYAVINSDGQLEIIPFIHQTHAEDDIMVEDCENFVLGERYQITRVVYDDASGTKWEYGTTDGATVYLNINNGFIEAESDVAHIFNSINSFIFYNFSVDNCPILSAELGDTITFSGEDYEYPTICQFEQSYAGDSWFGGYKLDIASPKQAETRVVDNTEIRIKNITTTVNRNLGEFTRTITDKIADVESDLEGQIESASSSFTQTANNLTIRLNGVDTTLGKYDEYFDFTNEGLIIGKTEDPIKARYGNSGLAFINGTTELAWLNTADGLGAPKVTIGENSTTRNRWQWITSADGSHSRFTRHK